MSHRTERLAMVFLTLSASCFEPDPYVILTIEDPENVAEGAVAVLFGEELVDMRRVPLAGQSFPTSIAITSEGTREVWTWVDAVDAASNTLGRGRVELTFKSDAVAAARVVLGAACSTASQNAPCVLADGTFHGTCIAEFCVAPYWTRHHSGDEHAEDRGVGIAADDAGNVFVAGVVNLDITGADGWLAKYDADGAKVWQDTHNVVASVMDDATGIALAPDGSVTIAGTLAEPGQTTNIFVQRQDSLGNEIWTRMYNGPSLSGYEWGYDVVADGNGGSIAVGLGFNTGASMPMLWAGHYSREGELIASTEDGTHGCACVDGRAVATTGNQQILIAGATQTATLADICVCRCLVANSFDCDTIAVVDGPEHLSDYGHDIIGLSDGFAVVGSVNNDSTWTHGDFTADMWIGRFDHAGLLVWSDSVGGVRDVDDVAFAVVEEPFGYLWMAGVIDQSFDGGNAWLRKYDAGGNPVVTIERTEKGYVSDIVIDSAGDVIVSGVRGAGTGEDGWVAKYTANGDLLWEDHHRGEASLDDRWLAVTVDEFDNIFVGGFETVLHGDRNIMARKYDPSGNELWTSRYNHAHDDHANHYWAVDVAPDGTVVGAGVGWVPGPGYSPWIRKYASDGALLWTLEPSAEYSDDRVGHMYAYEVTVASSGAIWATGSDGKTVHADDDLWIAQYDSDGAELWSHTYPGEVRGLSEWGAGLGTDSEGNLFVAGTINCPQDCEIWVAKLDADDKAFVWEDRCCDESGPDATSGLAVDHDNNVIVGGLTTHDTLDAWIRKYDSNGVELWTVVYDSPEHAADDLTCVAVDSSGNVVVAGSVNTESNGTDVWLRKYDPNGQEIWTQTYDGAAHRNDRADEVAVDPWDNVLVTGSETMEDGTTDIWIRKYAP